ncbi:hypothetical protein PCASD_09995 [Puccinia coronata f. sp. avenae]|uniref:Uncharacterized protein n=1 Tax=Puccinia coronata f. sp. avenae TaxID=200324 RepID=A0A2N5UV92_9BASI|nr:hypothetical protein PCASD_09995 [Puccinia coronata f. sp. avenae]
MSSSHPSGTRSNPSRSHSVDSRLAPDIENLDGDELDAALTKSVRSSAAAIEEIFTFNHPDSTLQPSEADTTIINSRIPGAWTRDQPPHPRAQLTTSLRVYPPLPDFRPPEPSLFSQSFAPFPQRPRSRITPSSRVEPPIPSTSAHIRSSSPSFPATTFLIL